jgi:hypothetical protein
MDNFINPWRPWRPCWTNTYGRTKGLQVIMTTVYAIGSSDCLDVCQSLLQKQNIHQVCSACSPAVSNDASFLHSIFNWSCWQAKQKALPNAFGAQGSEACKLVYLIQLKKHSKTWALWMAQVNEHIKGSGWVWKWGGLNLIKPPVMLWPCLYGKLL